MKHLLLVLFLSYSTAQFIDNEIPLELPENPSEWKFSSGKDSGRNGRISNGLTATDTQFPFVAEIGIYFQRGTGQLCTGSLISANWIISARHCVVGDFFSGSVSFIQAALGSADRLSSSRVIVSADMIRYPSCFFCFSQPDIALIRLSQAVTLNGVVNIIQLPSLTQQNLRFEGVTAVAAGWGRGTGSSLPQYLQYGSFRILSNFDFLYGSDTIVTQPVSGMNAFIEAGDSGGPLIVDSNNVPTLIGVNVWTTNLFFTRYQGSTRVGSYLQYVSDTTGIVLRN